MKWIRLLLLSGMLFIPTFLYSQLRRQEEAKLAYSVKADEDWYFTNAKPFLPYGDILRQANTVVAVRVCSREPVLKALFFSGRQPYDVLEYTKMTYGYTADRVLFLRTEDCGTDARPPIAATEVWLIPEGAVQPPSNEALRLCEVNKDPIGLNREIKSGREFSRTLDRFVARLKQEPSAIGVVVAAYYGPGNRSSAIRHNFNRALMKLHNNGIPANRYIKRLTVSSGGKSFRSPYPHLSTLEVGNECSRIQTTAR